ncbi:MAG: hypothetical protein IJR03_05310 [Bacteroidales bacterium]|nr:hypothetical protein [Bacteroidales bacterium]
MKKYIFIVFIFAFGFATGQTASMGSSILDKEFSDAGHNMDFGLYYSQFKANNETYMSHQNKDDWYALGLYIGVGAYNVSKYSVFLDCGIDVGWHKDIFMLNVPVALNVGYDIFAQPEKRTYLTAHAGIGYFFASLRNFDNGMLAGYYVYEDEHLEQHSAFVPLGIRFYYKNVFADFTYRMRFLKSRVKVELNEENDYYYDDDDWFKQTRRTAYNGQSDRIKNIETLPWTFTIGLNF